MQAQSHDITKAQETFQGLRERLSNTFLTNLYPGTIDDYVLFEKETDGDQQLFSAVADLRQMQNDQEWSLTASDIIAGEASTRYT